MSKLADLIQNLNDRPAKIVEMPGREGEQIGLWSLTLHEEEQARKRAYLFLKEVLKFTALDLEYDDQRALNDSVVCEVLASALRDPESPINPYCEDAKELREKLSSAEIQNLFNEYLSFVKERSVLKDVDNPEKEIDELVELVAQNFPIMTRLSHSASTSLRILLRTAVERLATSTKPSSLDGALPSASAKS